jgi:hypothetical protein
MSNFLRRLATGIRDFVYNVGRGQYESADGQVVPVERVIAAVERRQEDGAQLVSLLSGQLASGNITTREWQDMFAVELRRMHEQSFAAGRGGWDAITIADRRVIEQRVKDELRFLREFANDIKSGGLTEAQISARMRLYTEHVKASYWQGQNEAQKAANKSQMRRVLNPAEHCPDCTGYASQGWVPIGSLPVPGDGSVCRSNCACGVEYR